MLAVTVGGVTVAHGSATVMAVEPEVSINEGSPTIFVSRRASVAPWMTGKRPFDRAAISLTSWDGSIVRLAAFGLRAPCSVADVLQ
jgi:hypothetical protein